MVVIFIIALLAMIIGISVGRVRTKSRDTIRLAGLKTLAQAVEMYLDDHGEPPPFTGKTCCHECIGFDDTEDTLAGCYGNTDLKNALEPYLTKMKFGSKLGDYYAYYNYGMPIGIDIHIIIEDMNNCQPPFVYWEPGGTISNPPANYGNKCGIRIKY